MNVCIRSGMVCLTLGALALSLVGCGSGNSEPTATNAGETAPAKPIIVGFSQIGGANAYRVANTKSIQDAAKEAKIELKLSDAQDKQENQIKAIRSFIAQGVDVIILAPVVETGWEPVLNEAKRAGIPVIISDRKPAVSEDLYATVISSDYEKEGRMIGEWLSSAKNGRANIAEITGTAGSAPANDRHRGFTTEVEKYPDLKVVFSQSGEWKTSTGKEVTEAMLKSAVGQKVDVVFAHNDDMAIGAIQAIQAAGKKPGQDVLVMSIDGTKRAFEAMKDGTMNCVVECNPLSGPLLMQTVKDLVAKKQVAKQISIPDTLFEASQAAKELPNRKY